MTTICNSLKTRIDTDHGLGPGVTVTVYVFMDYSSSIPLASKVKESVGADKTFVLIRSDFTSGKRTVISYGYEDILYEGEVFVYTETNTLLDNVCNELVRIGNAYSQTTGSEKLTFHEPFYIGDRLRAKEYMAVQKWYWLKRNQVIAT